MKELITEVTYDEMAPVKAIELGDGDISIMDIAKDGEGRAGIGFKYLPGFEVGEASGVGGKRLNEIIPDLIIITDNIKSLEVLLDKVNRAISHLKESEL